MHIEADKLALALVAVFISFWAGVIGRCAAVGMNTAEGAGIVTACVLLVIVAVVIAIFSSNAD